MGKEISDQRVLCFINGSRESIISAYLLKKQYRHVHGVCFDFVGGLKVGVLDEFLGVDKEYIQKISKKLDIPISLVNAEDFFIDKFIDPLISHQLSGNFFNLNIHLVDTICRALWEKCQNDGMDLISSFGFVKIFKHQKTNSLDILSSQDLENDQSYLISRVSEDILWKMIFPLSEMRKNEADKLSTLIEIDYQEKKVNFSLSDLLENSDFQQYLLKKVGTSLIKPGVVIENQTGQQIGEHAGLFFHYLGQKKNFYKKNSNSPGIYFDILKINQTENTILVDQEKNQKVKNIILKKLIFSKSVSTETPIQVYVYNSHGNQLFRGMLHFFNNNYAHIELDTESSIFYPKGDFIFLFAQKERGKLLGSGVIESAGMMSKSRVVDSPLNKLEINEVINYENDKKNNSVSFNFF